jgi:phage tail-like protein
MDANGTRYHLLLGKSDWGACTDVNAEVSLGVVWDSLGSPNPPGSSFYWDPDRSQITLLPLVYPFAAGKGDSLAPGDRRGASADRFGNQYFIDRTQTKVLVRSSGSQTTSVFWSPDFPTVPAPRRSSFCPLRPAVQPTPPMLFGLAVTEHHYLVVGFVGGTAGLLLFDLYAGGAPRELIWPADVAFAPYAIAAAPGGGVWILDSINKRYWGMDAGFSVCGRTPGAAGSGARGDHGPFHPVVGSAPSAAPNQSSRSGLADSAFSLAAARPISIVPLADGSVLVLDRPDGSPSLVQHYRFDTLLEPPFSIGTMRELLPPDAPGGLSFSAQDIAFVPSGGGDPLAGRLLAALASGMQSFVFDVTPNADRTLRIAPLPDFYPMQLFGGKAIFYANGAAYYDSGDRFVPLVPQKRPRYVPDGTLTTKLFDSGDPSCVWHRLIFDAGIPNDAAVTVWSRAADDAQTLLESAFLEEPAPVRRDEGPELPFAALPASLASYELLLQRARGRFLQLQIRLAGNGKTSPRVRALRIYYPRFSYLRKYLPATYADNDSQGFLERFLANLEGFFTSIEDRIAMVQVLFDPNAAPSDALEWLTGWFGVAADPQWDDARRRLFLRHAMDLFQWRGTTRGIQMAIDLALSARACDAIFARDDNKLPSGTRVIEQFRTRFTPSIVVGDPTATDFVPNPVQGVAWTPKQGGAKLIAAWAEYAGGVVSPAPTTFPIVAPDPSDPTASAWTAFARATLGFVPSYSPDDADAWTRFLTRRYSVIGNLNSQYKAKYGSLDEVAPFASLPPDGAPLLDWYQFQGVVLPMAERAHRFRVLVPLLPGEASDSAQEQLKLDLVTRLVQLEKPAHTTFDVRFYWAMFRIGQVRLGYDTLLDHGSRVPQLMPRFVLGAQHLLEGHLAPGFPQDAKDPDILGRNALGGASNAIGDEG